jgi:lactobin A/cerein 7B family class IIb bacteriocin
MEIYNTKELSFEEKLDTEGGIILIITAGIGTIFGASYAVGYTAHFVYDFFD